MARREDLLLWLGIWAGPVAWFADLSLSYRLVELGRGGPHRIALYVVSACAVLLAVAGAALAHALGRRSGNGELGPVPEPLPSKSLLRALPRALLARRWPPANSSLAPSRPGSSRRFSRSGVQGQALVAERRRWMSLAGTAMGLFFALAVVAQAIPRLFLHRTDVP